MAQLLVRDLEEAVVHALRRKAAEEGTSVEEAHRRILRLALFSKKPKKGFKEFLLEMPGVEMTAFSIVTEAIPVRCCSDGVSIGHKRVIGTSKEA